MIHSKKPAYIISMTLNPTFKTIFWSTHASFIKKNFKMNWKNIISVVFEIKDEYEEDSLGYLKSKSKI